MSSTTGHGATHWIIAGVMFVVVLAGLSYCNAGGDSPADDGPFSAAARVSAYNAVTDRVRNSLKAPATATFVPVTEANYAPGNAGAIVVSGHVDAQNSFGAQARTPFVGTAEPSGDDWRVKEIDIGR